MTASYRRASSNFYTFLVSCEPFYPYETLSGTLVDRKLIANELNSKMDLLLEMLHHELDTAKDDFDQQEVGYLQYLEVNSNM